MWSFRQLFYINPTYQVFRFSIELPPTPSSSLHTNLQFTMDIHVVHIWPWSSAIKMDMCQKKETLCSSSGCLTWIIVSGLQPLQEFPSDLSNYPSGSLPLQLFFTLVLKPRPGSIYEETNCDMILCIVHVMVCSGNPYFLGTKCKFKYLHLSPVTLHWSV